MNGCLDEIDKKILRILQSDASLTSKEIADKINKSVAAANERIRRLKAEGYIQKVVAIVDRKKIDKKLVAFCHILLHDHTRQTLNTFEKEIAKCPEVMDCFQMTGTFDFILRVVTNDIDAYHDFYRNKLAVLPGVATVQSFFVMSEVKTTTGYPL